MTLRSERRQRAIAERAPQDSIRAKPPPVDDRRREEASVDLLTGIFDRAHFEARLSEESEGARRSGNDLILMFFDVDEFRALNRAHGRRAGDEALVLVARVLSSNARQADVVARYGADEFVVLMPATSLVRARDFFEEIRREVAERSARTFGFTLRLSAGAVKLLHDATGTPQDLLETADHAMYLAKRQGRDRFFATVAVGPGEDGQETLRGV